MEVQGSCGTSHMASRAQEIRETLPLVILLQESGALGTKFHLREEAGVWEHC